MNIIYIADQIIKFFVRFIIAPLFMINRKMQPKLIERILFHLNKYKYTQHFVSLVNRPKVPSGEGFRPVKLELTSSATTILIQGPIFAENDFTINSIYLYRSMFPNTKIILSTWSDESEMNISRVKRAGADVVLSEKPTKSGFLNFNYQRLTTIEGLKKAKLNGCKFILKTRSDQRIYNRYAISLLLAMIVKFPSKTDLSCECRLFFLSIFSLSNVPFHLSDMLQFGHIDDLINLWSIPDHKLNVDLKIYEESYSDRLTIEQAINNNPTIPEIWIGKHYAQRLYGSKSLQKPSENYLKLLKEAVGIVDKSQLDLYWLKYKAYDEHRDYRLPKISEHLSFAKWISLESNVCTDIINYDSSSKLF